MSIQLTDEEIETIKEIICEHGSDCPFTDIDKIDELKYKLGLAIRPTPEEIAEQEKRRKEFAESPFRKQISKIFKMNNEFLNKIAEDLMKDNVFYKSDKENGYNWPLKIRLPTDYNVK